MSYRDSKLFEPWSYGTLSLANRVVMAPMTRRMANEDGVPTPEMVAYYERRALNGVGLIVSEGIAIDRLHAYDTLTVPRLETDEQIAGWKRLVDAVRAAGGAFAPQLWHTGRMAADPIGPSPGDLPPRADGTVRPPVREMGADDFRQVLEAYRLSARSAKAIGCDALEIHGAHGYLLDSFLSPVDNRREDEYGGSPENRMRFPLETVRAIRDEVGPDYPILYRFSQWKVDDYREVKFHGTADLRTWVGALRDAGVDILHVSTRNATDPGFAAEGPKTLAGWSRELSDLPVIAVGKVTATSTEEGPTRTVSGDETRGAAGAGSATRTSDAARPAGGVTDPGPAIDLIEQGEADLLAVGRALIANPDWVPVVRDGDWRSLRPFEPSLLGELA